MAGHLDVHTGAVAAAGWATGATSADWEGYARTVRSALTDAAGLVHSGVVAGAIGDYGAVWNPQLVAVAEDVAALGRDTRAAAHTVTNADAQATSQVQAAGAAHEGTRSLLSRPINS